MKVLLLFIYLFILCVYYYFMGDVLREIFGLFWDIS